MRFWVGATALVAGCGRISFDAHPPVGSAGDDGGTTDSGGLTSCLVDTFDDGNADGWQPLVNGWAVTPSGPDGSSAYEVVGLSADTRATNPGLRGVTEAVVDLDFRINNTSNGDFDVWFMQQGWEQATNGMDAYVFVLGAVGADNPDDNVYRWDSGVAASLTNHVLTVQPSTWYHGTFALSAGHLTMLLDGAVYFDVTQSSAQPPPYDIVIGFYNEGVMDNVSVQCVR